MEKILATAFVALALGAAAHAAEPGAHGSHRSHATGAPASADAQLTTGVVRKVDRAAGKVTLAHDPRPNGMPAMTMSFKVADPELLEGLEPGQKVAFATDDAMAIVRLDKRR